VDTERWAAETPEAALLEKTVSSAGFAAVRSLIARNVDISRYSIGRIEVRPKSLLDTYRYSIERQDSRNQVLVSPLPRGAADTRAYIPGSSLKGAVRTALANAFAPAAGITSEDGGRRRPDYNEKIFGTIRQDPLRHLKFRDVPLPLDGTVIVEALKFSLKPDKRPTPKGYYEAASGGIDTGKPVIYETTVSLFPFPLHGKMVDRAFLFEALNGFYRPKFFEEREKFFARPHGQAIYKATAPLAKRIEAMKPYEALVRLGHFSHVECVTLDGVRRPVTRFVKGRQLPWGTTRTLAEGLYPFGWVIMEFDSNGKP
jgi:hypothetical protein